MQQGGLVTVSDKWQIVIPKRVRDEVKVKPKDKALIFPAGDYRIVVEILGEDIIERAHGALKKYDTDGKAFKRLLKQKKGDLLLEDRDLFIKPSK
ncbi:MAG: AbrB/MazE/SpoVT family DNA-binding domain-containing protein [Nitrospinota bacterium]